MRYGGTPTPVSPSGGGPLQMGGGAATCPSAAQGSESKRFKAKLVEQTIPPPSAPSLAHLEAESAEVGSTHALVERLLRHPDGLWRQVAQERDLGRLNRQLMLASSVPLALYGAVLGASNSVLQAVASAVKLPAHSC